MIQFSINSLLKRNDFPCWACKYKIEQQRFSLLDQLSWETQALCLFKLKSMILVGKAWLDYFSIIMSIEIKRFYIDSDSEIKNRFWPLSSNVLGINWISLEQLSVCDLDGTTNHSQKFLNK